MSRAYVQIPGNQDPLPAGLLPSFFMKALERVREPRRVYLEIRSGHRPRRKGNPWGRWRVQPISYLPGDSGLTEPRLRETPPTPGLPHLPLASPIAPPTRAAASAPADRGRKWNSSLHYCLQVTDVRQERPGGVLATSPITLRAFSSHESPLFSTTDGFTSSPHSGTIGASAAVRCSDVSQLRRQEP
jgi:hypothetical protein